MRHPILMPFLWIVVSAVVYALCAQQVLPAVNSLKDVGAVFATGLKIAGILFTSIVPLWCRVVFVYPAAALVIISTTTLTYNILAPLDPESEAHEAVNASSWAEYGQRLKLAYASKYGGENGGFNQEVDQRVGVMEHNGRGWTRTLAKSWLKRMSVFTEAK